MKHIPVITSTILLAVAMIAGTAFLVGRVKPPTPHHARFLVVVTQSNEVHSGYVVVSNKVPVRLSEVLASELGAYVARQRRWTNAALVNVVRLEE